MASPRNLLSRLVLLGAFVSPSIACETFDPPPEGSLVGVTNGIMAREPDAPIVLALSETFERGSLRFKLVRAVMDADRNLLDEQSPPLPDEFRDTIVVAYDDKRPGDPEASFGGTVDVKGRFVTITPDKALGYAVPYLLLIEPGLKDLAGNVTIPRQRLPFSYALPAGGSTVFPTGYYYFLINVELLSTQIQAYVYMEVDPDTGIWRANFTNGNRLPALNSRPGCPSCSGSAPICALIPTPRCVAPSLKQEALEEFWDFLPEREPPDGYYFIANGFAKDQADGNIAVGTVPFLIDITIGTGAVRITAENTTMAAIFEPQNGRWVGSGSINSEVVKINGFGEDPTKGTVAAWSLTQDEVDQVEAFGYPIPTDLEWP